MTEKEVSEEQSLAVESWIRNVKHGKFLGILFTNGCGVWKVDGEPILFYKEELGFEGPSQIMKFGPPILLCSGKHAKELEEAGIIRTEAEVAES